MTVFVKPSRPSGGASSKEAAASEQFAEHARQARDESRKAELFLQAAHLAEESESDLDRAVAFYQSALEADPSQLSALVSLERIFLRLSNWQALYQTYALHADVLHEQDRASAQAEVFRKMARIALERLSEEELAAVCYENLIDVMPGDPEAIRFVLARHERNGNWTAYEQVLTAQAPRVTDPVEKAELLRLLGETLQVLPDGGARALEAYEEAHRCDPQNPRVFQGLAAALSSQGRSEELIHLLEGREKLLSKSGGARSEQELFDLRIELVDLFAEQGSEGRNRAWPYLEGAASLRPEDRKVLWREARLAAVSGQPERAVQAYERLIAVLPEDSPGQASVLLDLAALYRSPLEELEKAHECLRKILEIYRDDPLAQDLCAAQRMFAEMAFDRGDDKTALLYYEALLEKTPPEEKSLRSEYLERVAQISDRLGEREEALKYYEQVLELFPRFRRALRGRARLTFELGRWKDALSACFAYYDALGGSDPEEERGLALRIAAIYEQLEDFDRAEESFRGFLRADPSDTEAQEGLGRVYERTGRFSEAATIWEELRKNCDGSGEEERWAEATERLARLAESRGKADEALSLYEEVARRRPSRPRPHERLALLCEARGQWKEAHEHYVQLLGALPSDIPEDLRARIQHRIETAERNAFYEVSN
ncbi:MAG: tetratricopeptide repeat protein [Bdellovibrionota bacterium]